MSNNQQSNPCRVTGIFNTNESTILRCIDFQEYEQTLENGWNAHLDLSMVNVYPDKPYTEFQTSDQRRWQVVNIESIQPTDAPGKRYRLTSIV